MIEGRLLHVTFGHSAAHGLRQTLQRLQRDERVAMYPDDLGFGPINPPSVPARSEFYTNVLCDEQRKLAEQTDAFWSDVAADASNHVAWFSRRSAQEYAGFLEYLSRRNSPPLIVDVADVEHRDSHGVVQPHATNAFAYLSTDAFIAMDLLGRVTRMSDGAFVRARNSWAQLKEQDARLRVVAPSGLVSVPITFFDELIVSCVTSEWQKCARVIIDAAHRLNSGEFRQTRELFLWFRLRELMDEGTVESMEIDPSPDAYAMWAYAVRSRR